MKTLRNLAIFLLLFPPVLAPAVPATSPRERIPLDEGWRFALGHATDTTKDFGHATAYFSYFAKAGYGDGPAGEHFDDRAWRRLDLPHDWAIELPIHEKGGHSHGYRAIGRDFPENSVGWYRRTFHIPESDRGRRISLTFDGVHRAAVVWVNGHYLGVEASGSIGFRYDVTDHLNYGDENTVVVRVDATLEEGWYYEGAGIYRHVWLEKTSPLHVAPGGVFVVSEPSGRGARVTVHTTVERETGRTASFEVGQKIFDAEGRSVARGSSQMRELEAGSRRVVTSVLKIGRARLWSIPDPALYRLVTTVVEGGNTLDRMETSFGIRTLRFDPDHGFFLNDERVQLQGANVHQDHAGVGTAIPDSLLEFRVKRLKEMGCNAYRTAHHPPAPELLGICDRLGMLVLDENRLMGTSPELMDRLERLILRDRNHPSVILWSLGNEEWAIEGNERGAQIAKAMQDFVMRLDPTRRVTAAVSGGCGHGISTVIDVMGFNYLRQCDIDGFHADFPRVPGVGTEETTTQQTRGVYEDASEKCHTAFSDRKEDGPDIEEGMRFYAERPYLAGHFLWTGFDYGGEPNPFHYPSISSQKGPMDLCGFPKDTFHYLRSWWTKEEVLHLATHWNWVRGGRQVPVRAYGNCEETELFLNGKSLGRKTIPRLSHVEWDVPYEPGTLSAKGYREGLEVSSARVETTGKPASVFLTADRDTIHADGMDVAVITVGALDTEGRVHPTADGEVTFEVSGPGRIIGVGNGDPSSHEKNRIFDTYRTIPIKDLRSLRVDRWEAARETAGGFDDSKWGQAFRKPEKWDGSVLDAAMTIIVRGKFDLGDYPADAELTLYAKSIGEVQDIYVNGHRIATQVKEGSKDQAYALDKRILHAGKNVYAMVGPPLKMRWNWDEPNRDPGVVGMRVKHEVWKRRLFNGLAQVIVQSLKEPGDIVLRASSKGLKTAEVTVQSSPDPKGD